MIARRIVAMDLDVLAVQEVEDIDTLKAFAREQLKLSEDDPPLYPNVMLVEGNDDRLIDVGSTAPG
ncbi:MAG: hypothetical protein HY744_12300 [Deltaproteobacteria bacterium]|nr:hypothetical protein [Deltaproteobacteria bacterium]